MRTIFGFLALLAVSAPGFPAAAQTAGVADAVFSELERRVVNGYFGKRRGAAARKEADDAEGHGKGRGKKGKKHKKAKKAKGWKGKSGQLPPGLARHKELPPGLARVLKRDGTLPPGLARRPLPEDLESRLPPPKKGLKRVIVDKSVVLIEEATGRVLDVMGDVLRDGLRK